MKIEEIIENFEFLDDWEDKYKYIIDLGNKLENFDEKFKIDEWKVEGCTSQVWLVPNFAHDKIYFIGDGDSSIVKGIIYIILSIFSGKIKDEILQVDVENIFKKLGLTEHLSPSRRNGLYSMIEKIKFYSGRIS